MPTFYHPSLFTTLANVFHVAKKLPALPAYNISRLNFRDIPSPGSDKKAVGADVTITSHNPYPIQLDIPELGFEILLPNCDTVDPYIAVAEAVSKPIAVKPREDVSANVHGIIGEIPDSLTRACPNSNSSPLDQFLQRYMNGEPPTVYVRGRKLIDSDTPDWIAEILSSITVPVPYPGHSFDSLIKDFSLSDVNFKLPDPMAEPDDPDADPKVSGTIQVLAALPKELNIDLNVSSLRATADVFYKKRKFGELNLRRWQKATSKKVEDAKSANTLLKIRSRVVDAPLTITDGDVFTDVVQKLIFGDKEVILDVKAAVDVRVETVLGRLVLKDVPTEGKIPVKRPSMFKAGSRGGIAEVAPQRTLPRRSWLSQVLTLQ
jgi:hypothetical protein